MKELLTVLNSTVIFFFFIISQHFQNIVSALYSKETLTFTTCGKL